MTRRDVRKMFAVWVLPGISIKRWILGAIVGMAMLMIGFALLLNLHPVAATIQFVQKVAPAIPSWGSGLALFLGGFGIILLGWRQTSEAMLDLMGSGSDSREDLMETLYREGQLRQGPKVVAIGGGTGLSTLLRGLKAYTSNITAIVTVADDGGSSGRLRQEFGIIPPGDIRNCIAALADQESLITELFQYRFQTGSGLEGHSFGNLFLSALCEISGNMFLAIKESSKVLKIRGRVLPASLANINLVARMEDGTEVFGESNIPENGGRIMQLRCEPACPTPLPEALQAIEDADFIILGPGSLYTSVLPNLLMPQLVDALDRSDAPKVYVCNVMTQPGETDGFSVSDHVKVILNHCPNRHVVDAVLVNNGIPEHLLERYKASNAYPIDVDYDRLKELKVHVIEASLVEPGNAIRHSPHKLSRKLVTWFKRYQRLQNKHKLMQAKQLLDQTFKPGSRFKEKTTV